MHKHVAEPIHIVAAVKTFGEEFIGLNISFQFQKFHPILGIELKQERFTHITSLCIDSSR